jgi:hypothetical protein
MYSINFKKWRTDENPIIMFNYDISPIAMMIKIKQKDFLHLITHLCAITGGVFVVFKILNRLLTL